MTPPALNVIVPMAGRGTRFRKAGFETYKPFIEIDGRPMIRHVLDVFPEDVKRYIVTSRELLTDDELAYLQQDLACTVIFIPPHKEGPAYTIAAAADQLPLDQAFFVSYCDIAWTWDFEAVRAGLHLDGVVYTHQGFHPHLVGNNFSAFCRPKADRPDRLAEIREKGSFTDDWMNEPLSIGAFFIKSGHAMVSAARRLIADDTRVSGEFFPSLIFNQLLANGGEVGLEPVGFFIHWGVPEQLDDFARWKKIVGASPAAHDGTLPDNIMCMAGLGARMKAVSDRPKALTLVDGQPMYRYVADRFPARKTTLVTVDTIARQLHEEGLDDELLILPVQTQSQFETLVEAGPLLRERKDFFLTSCDAYGLFDFSAFRATLERRRPAAVIFTFRPSLTHAKMASHHTHVSLAGDRVSAVHVKGRSSDSDVGLAGFFWIEDGSIFSMLGSVPHWSGGEMVADSVFKHFVDQGLDVLGYPLDEYVHLGTPEEFLEHRYWFQHKSIHGLS